MHRIKIVAETYFPETRTGDPVTPSFAEKITGLPQDFDVPVRLSLPTVQPYCCLLESHSLAVRGAGQELVPPVEAPHLARCGGVVITFDNKGQNSRSLSALSPHSTAHHGLRQIRFDLPEGCSSIMRLGRPSVVSRWLHGHHPQLLCAQHRAGQHDYLRARRVLHAYRRVGNDCYYGSPCSV